MLNHLITRARRLLYTRLSPTKFDSRMLQYQWYRAMTGGTFVKFYGKWRPAEIVFVLQDGTRCLTIPGSIMLAADEVVHESFPGIDAIELWT